MNSQFKFYYKLTKPGIVYANTLTAVAGYLFVSKLKIDLMPFLGLIFGTACLIASACVFNNVLDISIDRKMSRTATRGLVSGKINKKSAIYFLTVLLIVSSGTLLSLTNLKTFIVGIIAYVFYVFVYGYFKRHSVFGTLVGTIPGSASIIAGGVCVNDNLSWSLVLLGLIMVVWQMAHFYAIAIYRLSDYIDANLPVWPVVKGVKNTSRQIILFIILFLVLNLLILIVDKFSVVYLIVMMVISSWWLLYSLISKSKLDITHWAKKVFINSLIVNLVFIIMVSFFNVLP